MPACALANPVPAHCDRNPKRLVSRNDQTNQRLEVDVKDLAVVQDATVAAATASPSTSTTTSTTAPTTSTSTSTTSTIASSTSTSTAPPQQTKREAAVTAAPVSSVRPVTPLAPAGAATILAVTSGPESEDGSYKATPFAMSNKWDVGIGSGEFTWTYNFPVLAAPAGATPDVSLNYSSGSVDGMVSGKNSQASPAGLGWGDFANAFIERSYRACSKDGQPTLGDMCWGGDNATISLNGHSSQLVKDSTNSSWHLKDDPRWRVEHLTGADNGDNDGEHWKVTTPDGTQYWFGIGKDPEALSNPLVTASTWTVPVIGNNAGEPCNTSPTNMAANLCTQSWRWNLDRMVDPNGNERWYQYVAETNRYQAVTGAVDYVRAGYLKNIWYGSHQAEDDYAAQITFDVNYRCNRLDATCVADGTGPPDMTYPDLPTDLQCGGGFCNQTSPTFFQKMRYTGVHMAVAGQQVDYFKLTHSFSTVTGGDLGTDNAKLFLTGIQRTGCAPTTTCSDDGQVTPGPKITLPPTTFEPVSLQNRFAPASGEAPMKEWRIKRVTDEFGRQVNVTYGQPHVCPNPLPNPPQWDTNTKDCFAELWAPQGQTPTFRGFNKYLTTQVEVKDTTGGSPAIVTKYIYGDQINTSPDGAPQSWSSSRDQAFAAWHHNQDPLAAQGDITWDEWRGYQDVLVVQGQSRTRYKVFRGMDDDLYQNPAPGGFRDVSLSSLDGTVTNTPDSNWLAGKILDEASLRGDGTEEKGTVHTYEQHRTAAVACTPTPSCSEQPPFSTDNARWVGENDTVTRLRSTGTSYRRQRSQTVYNALLAWPEQVIEHGFTDVSGDERCTKTDFVFNVTPTTYLLDYPQRVTRYDNGTSCSGTAVTRTETAYDNGAVGDAPTKGNPTTSRVQTSSAPSPNGTWSVTTTTYDSFGRPVTVTDPNGHPTTTTRLVDSSNGIGYPFRITVQNAKNQVTTTDMNVFRGVPNTTADANGKTTTYAYDPLGRVTSVWQPTEATTGPASWVFSYDIDPARAEVPVIRTRQLEDTRYLDSWVLYDSLLRERQTQTPSPSSGKVIVKESTYDNQGRAATANVPEAVTATPGNALAAVPANGWRNFTQTFYDTVNRPVWEIFWADDSDADQTANNAQRSTTTSYTPDTTEVDPMVGGNTRTKVDGLGRTVEVAEHNGTSFKPTAYTYNKADNLLTVTDPASNKITYGYDMAGRRISMADPDAGSWSYGYDAGGNQTYVTDAKNAAVYTNYDVLNRPTERRKDNPVSGTQLATWNYDASGELGLLDKSTRITSSGNWVVDVSGYDARNRPTGRSWTVPAGVTGLSGSYAVTYGYDKADHPTSVGYPAVGGLAAETVTTAYDDFGLPSTMTGAAPYVSIGAYDDRARPSLFGFGPSSDLSMGKFWSYDLNQQLGTMQASAHGGGQVQSRTMAYDNAGNVTERNTTLSGASFKECYGYDQRNRLTAAYTTTSATTCASGSNKGTGANPYNQTYAYTDDGNLQTLTNVGSSPTNYTYPAGGPSSVRPHAPTAVGSNSYTWDANGNQATRTVGGQTDTLTWDEEHHLATVNGSSGNNSFVYDADGNRLLRQTPTGKTLYIEGHEITAATSGATTAVRSYGFGGQPVATRTPSALEYLITDNQGSVEQVIPSGSATTSVTRTYFPYGKLRTGGQPATDHTWIGQIEDDSTSLQYLNARYYDPTTAVFTAPDPIIDTTTPKGVHPYQYTFSNPTTKTDPTGDIPSECVDKTLNCQVTGGGGLTGSGGIKISDNPNRDDKGDPVTDPEPPDAVTDAPGIAGFPFWLFNPWHRAVQLAVAEQVGGQIECGVAGGGPNGGLGRADVCRYSGGVTMKLWEVKYFGPNGLISARDQLKRYLDAPGCTEVIRCQRGQAVEPGWAGDVFYFSPEPGVVLYVPKMWVPAVLRDEKREHVLMKSVPDMSDKLAFLKRAGIKVGGGGTDWGPVVAAAGVLGQALRSAAEACEEVGCEAVAA
jgi:RHS repeat-associated protein